VIPTNSGNSNLATASTATAIVIADMIGVGVFTSLGFQVKDITSTPSLLAAFCGAGGALAAVLLAELILPHAQGLA
jgi:basic amino acid/polyamine antiporter, APA family